MKFIKLEILNLASLDRQGGEVINFEEGPLGESTIFSIVGPTGSGKSTILDAICLALYNRAPRYAKDGKKNASKIDIYGEKEEDEKYRLAPTDPRNILTRGKKEGYSKLTFLANNGDVYRAEWYVSMGTKKIQDPVTELYKISQKDGVQTEEVANWEKLPQIIGLAYDQFLRTVLIAQGSFANFLTANDEKRFELLEKLIGCEEMYVNIVQKIKDKKKEAYDAYNKIESDLAAQKKDVIEDEGELDALKKHIAELEAIEKKAKEELLKVTEAIAWYTTEETLQANIAKYETAFNEAKLKKEAQREQTELLALHDATLPATGLYKEMKTAEANVANLEKALEQFGMNIAKYEQDLTTEVEVNLAKLQQEAEKAAHELDEQKPHINKARAIKAQMQPLLDAQEEKRSAYQSAKTEADKMLRLVTDKTIDIDKAEELYDIKKAELEKRDEKNRKELETDELKAESIKRDEDKIQTLRDARTLLLSRDVMTLRNNLKEGEPCPVCGATHHPYHDESVYTKVTTELDEQIREAEEKLNRKKARVKTLTDELSTEDALYKYVAMLKIAKDAAEKKKAQDQAEKAFIKAKEDVDRKKEELKQEIGEKDPDAYEKTLTDAKNKADNAVAEKKEEIGKIREKLTGEKGRKTATESQKQEQSATREGKQQELTQWLARYNAENSQQLTEEDIVLLCSYTNDWEAIRNRQKQLSQAYTSTETTLANERKAHEEHQQKRPEQEKEALLARKTELEGMSNTELVEATARLQRHETAKQQMGTMLKQMQEAALLKMEWEQIDDAIGADGKRLRKIAQGYTLRFLIEHANVEIRKFNSRYELMHVKNSLGIRVIDHDRADDVRDTTSLSGGETFIVSLGLALGLSALSSRNIRFENLFIDEGFGTLDPSTLDHVIDSLAMLQTSQGKKVGIISHTESMERITTQIRIIKNGDSGSSHIEIHP